MDLPSPGALQALALACLRECEPARKMTATREAAARIRAWADGGDVAWCRAAPGFVPLPLPVPGRPDRPRLVPPRDVPQRGLGDAVGRAALVHAVAHIEFNAVNLAWDAVYRFPDLPPAYYLDWVGVADDEARHFTLLAGRLRDLGHAYGDFDAHNGLWEMAVKTAADGLARMALVPRVLEARGLDVTPGMIRRLRAAGDATTADLLDVILAEEVAHVAAGSRWFVWHCARTGRDPQSTFAELVRRYARGAVRGPFNIPARLAAGFALEELEHLDALE